MHPTPHDPVHDAVVAALVARGAEFERPDVEGRSMLFWHDTPVFVGHPLAELDSPRGSAPVIVSVLALTGMRDLPEYADAAHEAVATLGPAWSCALADDDGVIDIWVDRIIAEHEIAEPGLGRALDLLLVGVEHVRTAVNGVTPAPARRGVKPPREWVGWVLPSELNNAMADRWRCTSCRWVGTGHEADSEVDLSDAFRVSCPRCGNVLFRCV